MHLVARRALVVVVVVIVVIVISSVLSILELCVRACVRACVSACLCARVCVCSSHAHTRACVPPSGMCVSLWVLVFVPSYLFAPLHAYVRARGWISIEQDGRAGERL